MDIKACIFDLDGVIVDTAEYHYLAWCELAENLGFSFSKHENERLKGVSRTDSLEILLKIGNKHFDSKTKNQLADKKNRRYIELISQMTPDEILPGVIDFLDYLKSKNILTALGSASKNAPMILEKIDMISYFDAVIDGTKVSKAKPDPEVFLKGAEALKVSPSQCIVFEDAVAGIEAAANAGMYSIGIGNETILSKADFVVNNFVNFDFEKVLTVFKNQKR
jgi:beta-phosphoglucomutase